MTDNQQPSVTQADEDTRSNSRFFFELGLGAALAHSLVEGGVPSNDHAYDRCWDVALASYEDPQEMDRRLANADAADLRAELAEAKKQSEFRRSQWAHYENLMVNLRFVNSDAIPKEATLTVSEDSIAPIMAWYGAFYAGDRYEVFADGVKLKKDCNGEVIPWPQRLR